MNAPACPVRRLPSPIPSDLGGSEAAAPRRRRFGFTLVETMVALSLLAVGLGGFLSTFVQSRRVTEASVLHAAASSLLYGLLEQIKGVDYQSLPSVADPADPTSPWQITLRIAQDTASRAVPLTVIYTQDKDHPQGPLTTPSATATAADLGAVDNVIGPLTLSSTSGTQSQKLQLTLWIWIDNLADVQNDVKDVKKVTVIYTYTYLDGMRTRVFRDREVIIRTLFDQ